jgi:hypothetical protein
VREAEEVEGFGLPVSKLLPLFGRVATKAIASVLIGADYGRVGPRDSCTAKKLAWPFRLARETDVVLGAGTRRQTVRVSFCEEGA